jgi:transcriptional regulator with XRE-family HTH domain
MTRPAPTTAERRYADALRTWRERRGLTKTALAEAMAYHPSRVSHIEAGRQPPTAEFSRQAETILQTGGELLACWDAIATTRFVASTSPIIEHELRFADFIAWLADHSDASLLSLYATVNNLVARLESEPPSRRFARDHARAQVSRAQLARAVVDYYGEPAPNDGVFYRARVGDGDIQLSVLTRPEWLHTVDLTTDDAAFAFVPPSPAWSAHVDDQGVSVALDRLAMAEVKGTIMFNNPLYRLLDIDLAAGKLAATLTTVEFAEHALTTELIEGELLGAIGNPSVSVPLRDTYLPSIASVFALRDRPCVGGAVSVLAIARRRPDGRRDYVMFVQERSGTVLNLAGKLAVVPKGFHQPTGEPASEAHLSVTIRRELEEELLGRQDLEQVGGPDRHVDLLHAQRVTEPLAWLIERSGALRVECTGFGFNLVTGNYEFACLIVVEDDEWWHRFGHLIESNWEAERIHRYSSLDSAGLAALVVDQRWGNESLFSLLQAVRRLSETGEARRLAMPNVDVLDT